MMKECEHDVQGPIWVKRTTPNKFGLYDVLGNVWEWVYDSPRVSDGFEASDPVGQTSNSVRVIKGGSWASPGKDIRIARRGAARRNTRNDEIGFRLLLVAE
jgi:formylglycine-generating enzyme required for sulfatase activity